MKPRKRSSKDKRLYVFGNHARSCGCIYDTVNRKKLMSCPKHLKQKKSSKDKATPSIYGSTWACGCIYDSVSKEVLSPCSNHRELYLAVNVIKLQFPDGIYSFWEASMDNSAKRIWFRVRETLADGVTKPKGGNITPQARMANLVKELLAYDPELALSIPDFHRYRPADLSQVVAWLAGHNHDCYDLIDFLRIR